jgi:dethiobiotin synthetase
MRVLFVTGTDTGVGKTFVTACCLAHLLRSGMSVRAVKPFCSGARTDAELLWELQGRELALDSINPFYFKAPLAPWTAARLERKLVRFDEALQFIREHREACDLLLIEGAGGLLSPLGEGFNAPDLIVELGAEVILVVPNKLGVLNHTLLTVEALAHRNVPILKIALVNVGSDDAAALSNELDLRQLLPKIPIYPIEFARGYQPEAAFMHAQAGPAFARLVE